MHWGIVNWQISLFSSSKNRNSFVIKNFLFHPSMNQNTKKNKKYEVYWTFWHSKLLLSFVPIIVIWIGSSKRLSIDTTLFAPKSSLYTIKINCKFFGICNIIIWISNHLYIHIISLRRILYVMEEMKSIFLLQDDPLQNPSFIPYKNVDNIVWNKPK